MSRPATGRLIGIADRPARRAPMQTVEAALIEAGGGVEHDHKGKKFPRRGVTLLAREAWEAALADLAKVGNAHDLPWTARRANLLIEGVELPRALGGVVKIGPVVLEITYPTTPCKRMDEARDGLMRALYTVVARRRHLPGARGRARGDRRSRCGAGLAARAHDPAARLSKWAKDATAAPLHPFCLPAVPRSVG
jgi:MOSC domain-containing protein YiiM